MRQDVGKNPPDLSSSLFFTTKYMSKEKKIREL
jgi:hypothetical protein